MAIVAADQDIQVSEVSYQIVTRAGGENVNFYSFKVSVPSADFPGIDGETWLGMLDSLAETVRAAIDTDWTAGNATLGRMFLFEAGGTGFEDLTP